MNEPHLRTATWAAMLATALFVAGTCCMVAPARAPLTIGTDQIRVPVPTIPTAQPEEDLDEETVCAAEVCCWH